MSKVHFTSFANHTLFYSYLGDTFQGFLHKYTTNKVIHNAILLFCDKENIAFNHSEIHHNIFAVKIGKLIFFCFETAGEGTATEDNEHT